MSNSNTLIDLREHLTEDQRAIINYVWQYYLQRNEWIPTKSLHHEFSKVKVVIPALEKLGGSIICEIESGNGNRYGLTFYGLLLTDNGLDYEKLIIRYLEYVRGQYSSDPEVSIVQDANVVQALGIDQHESTILGILINLGNFNSGGSYSKANWSFNIPRDVDNLYDSDPNTYFQNRVSEMYDPNMPWKASERLPYVTGKIYRPLMPSKEPLNEFWFIENQSLQELLSSDWQEAQKVYRAEGWKSCIILCGGILEGMLLDVLSRDKQKALNMLSGIYEKRLEQRKPPKDLGQWGLSDLVDIATAIGLLRKGTFHLTNAVREYRNLIHPGRQIKENVIIDPGQANIAIETVRICMSDLATIKA